jgi:hypothetical protein
MSKRNLIPKLSVALLIAPFVYYWAHARWPRLHVDNLGDNVDWNIVMFQLAPAISIFANLIVGVHRSVVAKDYVWTLAMVLLFPLSFWYTFFVDRGAGPAASQRQAPEREPGRT